MGSEGHAELLKELARRATAEVSQRVNGTVRFELGVPATAWLLDLDRAGGAVLEARDAPGGCTFHIPDWSDLALLLSGALTPTAALLDGRLRVEGDLAVAMRVERALFRP